MRNFSATLFRPSRSLLIAAFALLVGACQFQIVTVACAGTDSTDVEVKQIGEQLNSDDPEERTAALLKLPALGSRVQPLLPRLLEMLADDKQTQLGNITAAIRYHDIKILSELGPIVTDAMIEGLHSSKKPIRMGAAEVLGNLNDPKAVDALVKALDDDDRELAGRAMTSLENLGDLSVDAVIAAMKSEKAQVRQFAASTLGQIQLPRVVHPIAALLSDSDKTARECAAYAIGNLAVGNPGGTIWNPADKVFDPKTADRVRAENHAELRKAILDALITALNSGNSDARLAALNAAYRVVISNGHETDPRAAELRTSLVNRVTDADPEIRKQAVGVILLINNQDVMPSLVAALHDPSVDVRAQAANGLRYRLETYHEYDDAKFVEPLTTALDDADKRVRASAAEALGHIQSKSKNSAAPQLAKLLSDPEPEVATAAIQALVPMGSAVAANPIAALLDNPKLRGRAAAALAGMKDPRAIGVLRAELANKNTNVINALGTLKDRESVEPLIVLLDDKEYSVRQSATAALGAIGDRRAVQPLIDHLESDPQLTGSVADSLSKLGDPRAIKPIIQAANMVDNRQRFQGFEPSRHEPLHNPVSWPLVHMGLATIEPLGEALKDPSDTVREVAVWVLYNLPVRDGEFGRDDMQPAIEPLVAALSDRSEFVRNHAAMTLGQLGDARAVDALINVVAASDQKSNLYSNAASYLNKIHDPKCVEPLIKMLDDPRPEVRATAVWAFGSFREERVIEPLLTALNDTDSAVREGAAVKLGYLKTEKAIQPLLLRLADEAKVRKAAAEALSRIGAKEAVEPLAKLTDDKSFEVRCAAAMALVRLDDPRGVESITASLNDSEAKNRENALVAVYNSFAKSSQLVKPLVAALNDDSIRVRLRAASALGQIGNPEAVAALLAKLDDRENLESILKALGASKDERAFAPLLTHLDDPEPRVRSAAVYWIATFPKEKCVQPLIDHLGDSSVDVRVAIIDALAKIHAENATDQLTAIAEESDPIIRAHATRALKRMKQ